MFFFGISECQGQTWILRSVRCHTLIKLLKS